MPILISKMATWGLRMGGALGLLCAMPPPVLSAATVLREDFAYPDGVLRDVSKRAWSSRQGQPDIRVEGRSAVLVATSGSGQGYLARPLSAPLQGSEATARLVVRFEGPVSEATGDQAYVFFQFTDAAGQARRGRLAARPHAQGESMQLGVTARDTRATRWAEQALALHEEHVVLLNYDGESGIARIWINPTAATTQAHAESVDSQTIIPGRVSLQTDAPWPLGRVLIRQIGVVDNPIRVAPAAATPAQPVAATPAPSGSAIVEPPPADKFLIFLLIGQSNMAGRGAIDAASQPRNPRILALGPDGHWGLAADPLHSDKPTAGVGPGLAFAEALLSRLPADVSIGLIPTAFGGSAIDTWSRSYGGPNRWPDGSTYYARAVALTRAVAPAGTVAGILWNQGSADSGSANQDEGRRYGLALHRLIADLREDLATPDLPFVAATLGPWRGASAEAINNVYRALPAAVPATAIVDTARPDLRDALKNIPADPPHYDTPSMRLLGRQYAEAFWALQQTR